MSDNIEKEKLLERIQELEDVLRFLAFYLGVGGYNDEIIDPENYKRKILSGIDHHVSIAQELSYNKGYKTGIGL